MNTYDNKTQKNKGQSPATENSQKQRDGKSIFQFEDNRHGTVAQRKQVDRMNSRNKANNHDVIQLERGRSQERMSAEERLQQAQERKEENRERSRQRAERYRSRRLRDVQDLSTRDKLLQSNKVSKSQSSGDDLKQKLIKLFAAGKIKMRSIDENDAQNLLMERGLIAPGGDRDIEKHVLGSSSGSTAYISVSERPTNRFRGGGAGQAIIKPSSGADYIPNADVLSTLEGNPTAVHYAGRAYEGLYHKSIAQKDVVLLRDEISKEEMAALHEAVNAEKINPDSGWSAYQEAMQAYHKRVQKNRDRRK